MAKIMENDKARRGPCRSTGPGARGDPHHQRAGFAEGKPAEKERLKPQRRPGEGRDPIGHRGAS